MKIFTPLFFLLIFLISCSGRKVPADVLPPEKMESVLWDVMLADQMADYYVQKDTSLSALAEHTALYQQVFRIHKTTKEDFIKSLRYYEAHPHLIKPVIDSLQKKAERLTVNTRPLS